MYIPQKVFFHLPEKYDSRGQNSLGQITPIPVYGGFFVPRPSGGLVALMLLPTGGHLVSQQWMGGLWSCDRCLPPV